MLHYYVKKFFDPVIIFSSVEDNNVSIQVIIIIIFIIIINHIFCTVPHPCYYYLAFKWFQVKVYVVNEQFHNLTDVTVMVNLHRYDTLGLINSVNKSVYVVSLRIRI